MKRLNSIILVCGRNRTKDAIKANWSIKNNDITSKLSDVSNTVVNEIDISFIRQHRLGNT